MKPETCTEVLEVLSHMEEKYQHMIPEHFMNLLNKHKNPHYDFHVDMNLPFKEQQLGEETYTMLALIDSNYWSKEDKNEGKFAFSGVNEIGSAARIEYRDIVKDINQTANTSAVKVPQEAPVKLPMEREPSPFKKVLGFIQKQPVCVKVIDKVKSLFNR